MLNKLHIIRWITLLALAGPVSSTYASLIINVSDAGSGVANWNVSGTIDTTVGEDLSDTPDAGSDLVYITSNALYLTRSSGSTGSSSSSVSGTWDSFGRPTLDAVTSTVATPGSGGYYIILDNSTASYFLYDSTVASTLAVNDSFTVGYTGTFASKFGADATHNWTPTNAAYAATHSVTYNILAAGAPAVAAVPEPTTFLSLVGLIGIVLLRRNRRDLSSVAQDA